jgi:hypothetical protein
MAPGKAPLILHDRPHLLVGQHAAESDHAGSRRTVLDHPKDFTLGAMAPEPVMVKVTRGRIEAGRAGPISAAGRSMAGDTDAFPFIKRFSLFDDFGGSGKGLVNARACCI